MYAFQRLLGTSVEPDVIGSGLIIPKSQVVDDLLIGFYQLGANETYEGDQVALVGFR